MSILLSTIYKQILSELYLISINCRLTSLTDVQNRDNCHSRMKCVCFFLLFFLRTAYIYLVKQVKKKKKRPVVYKDIQYKITQFYSQQPLFKTFEINLL